MQHSDLFASSYRLRIAALLTKEQFNETIDVLKPSIEAVITAAKGQLIASAMVFHGHKLVKALWQIQANLKPKSNNPKPPKTPIPMTECPTRVWERAGWLTGLSRRRKLNSGAAATSWLQSDTSAHGFIVVKEDNTHTHTIMKVHYFKETVQDMSIKSTCNPFKNVNKKACKIYN